LSIDLGDGRYRPYLKMINPSLGVVHVEGVHPDCKTVEEAICFRNQLKEFSLPITLDGQSLFNPQDFGPYHQQGDCLMFIENELPSDASMCSHKIAGEGLIRHLAQNGEIYELNNKRFIRALKDCSIGHPEHKPTTLPEGVYEVKKVLEYDHGLEESREVID
jgi:hypothetical protein